LSRRAVCEKRKYGSVGGARGDSGAYPMRQRRRCPRQERRRRDGARNPKGAWGLRAISALLVVDDVHQHRLLLAP